MIDDLSQYPDALKDETLYPWEADPPRWTLEGKDHGKALCDLGSNNLVAKRRQLVKKQSLGRYFERLIEEIDKVLYSREGL